MNRTTTTLLRIGALVALVGSLAACGSDKDSESSSSGPAAASGESTVEITGAWARTSPTNSANGAAYVTLTSSKDDALLSVEVDASVAKTAEVHETVMASSSDTTMAGSMGSDTTAMGGAMGSDASAPAAMTMQPVDKVELPAGETVELKPGGYHIMLMKLAKPLEKGSTIKVTLTFATAASQTVDVPVRDEAP